MIVIKNKYSREVFTNLALISQLGISMLVPTFLLLAIGLYLEKRTGWFLTVPCLIIGMMAGFRNVYVLAMKANRKSDSQKQMEEENRLVDEAIEKWNKNK